MEAQQGPPPMVEENQEDGQDQEDQFTLFKPEYFAPMFFFLFGIFVQTYRPVFHAGPLTVILAEIILGITLGCMCMIMGVVMTTQIPTIGLVANMINYHLKMPHMISYQLMPLPVN